MGRIACPPGVAFLLAPLHTTLMGSRSWRAYRAWRYSVVNQRVNGNLENAMGFSICSTE
jgi:hypothetical protein